MQFIDLKTRQDRIRGKIDARIAAVLDHGQYVLGPEVRELEERLAAYVGTEHCVTVSSGTDSLLIALMALGVGPGDEVITPPYTWISTAEVIALLGATPVFSDVREDTWNLDEAKLEAALTERTKAIMPVGIYGQTADMDAIAAIAEPRGLPVIEDAAQSFGATFGGKKSCALSAVGSTSFFPSKPLGCYGDGGALFTDDDDSAAQFRQIRVHGQARKHHHPVIGLNGRLDTLQAAILLEHLEVFPEEVRLRQEVARRYDELLAATDLPDLRLPQVPAGSTSVYAQYTILHPERDRLRESLSAAGVPSVSYYAVPLHLQPVFADLGHEPGAFPVSERIAAQCLSLPMSPYLSEEDQEKVVEAIRDARSS